MAKFITDTTNNKVVTNTWMADKILPSSFEVSSNTSAFTINLSLAKSSGSLGGSTATLNFTLEYIRGYLNSNSTNSVNTNKLNHWYL